MNEDLSPSWLSTNDEENHSDAPAASGPNLAETKTAVRIPVGGHRVSRTPAAIVGILLSVSMGFSLLNGIDGMKAQIPGIQAKKLESAVEIHLTNTGVVPKSVDVNPGQKIVWINDQSIPHILESETLLGENGTLLYTPAIFPGSNYEFWVSPLQEPGRNSYLSTTSVETFGEINVLDSENPGATPPKPSAPVAAPRTPVAAPAATGNSDEELTNTMAENSPVAEDVSGVDVSAEKKPAAATVAADTNPDTIDSSDPLAPHAQPLGSLVAEEEKPLDQDALIPYNPYTVGSTNKHVSDTAGAPLHGGAPLKKYRPIQNTKTGPGLWIVSMLSIGALAWFTRKSFRAFR